MTETARIESKVGAPTSPEQELQVRGMTCAVCVGRVEDALTKVPGVESATVNLVTEKATVRLDPGRVSMAQLQAAVEKAGYGVLLPEGAPASEEAPKPSALELAEAKEYSDLKRDVVVSAVLAVPLLALGMSHGVFPWTDGPIGRALQLVLATPIVFGPGRRFLRLAWAALKHGGSDMNTLVSLGTLAAWAWSAVVVLMPSLFPHAEHGAQPHIFFEAAGAIITFVLVGKLLETRARKRLSEAVRGLVSLVPKLATRLRLHKEFQVHVSALKPGDVVLVRPGERAPADGEVIDGSSGVDESTLTGESIPADKAKGSQVYGGTLNTSGALKVKLTRTGAETALARIVHAVESAQGSRAPISRLADRVARVFVPVVVAIALVAFAVWWAMDPTVAGFATAVQHLVAVLVIACPCALGLATPAAVAVGTGRGAELGVLVKGGAVLEALSHVDTVLLDKTGTVTEGKPALTDVVALRDDAIPVASATSALSEVEGRRLPVGPSTPLGDEVVARGELVLASELKLLALVAAVERPSEHPVARALVSGAEERGAERLEATGFTSEPGLGVEAVVGGRRVRVGTSAWLRLGGINPSALEARAEELAAAGRTPAFVGDREGEGTLLGLVAVADRSTEGARATMRSLEAMGITTRLVTGDRRATAEAVAKELGIEHVDAEVKPEDKARVAASSRAGGHVVAMVGDGVNDAPALASADVGIAIGTGADVAAAAADVVLLRGGISTLPRAFELARATLRTIRQNLFWAFIYNVAGIPLAAGALLPVFGFELSPVFASAAMSLSSVSVLANSLRLRRFGR